MFTKQTKVWLVLTIVVSILALGSACNKTDAPMVNEVTITGVISYEGAPPAAKKIDTSADPVCGSKNPNLSTEDTVVTNGKLANTFVYIKDGTLTDGGKKIAEVSFPAATSAATLDQVGCHYRPHVLGVQTGQTLKITNSDPTTHNVHPTPKNNPEWNQSQTSGAPALEKTFARAEVLVPVKCNQHPWMKSYIGVLKHPFFAVSAEDGTFTIKGVPPGTYTVAAWKEGGATGTEKTMSVTVAANGAGKADFSFGGAASASTKPMKVGLQSQINKSKAQNQNMNKGLHRFALLVACATFFLIIAGALVTSHDAGLATSDWPLSNGQVFPKMVGNLFWEHGHRMVATTVGMLTIVLAIYLCRDERHWIRWLGLVALVGVIAQGLLGGLTVKLMLPLAVSSAHATLAQLFFCTTVSLAVFTSRSWMQHRQELVEKGSIPLRYLCVATLVTILTQLVLGATLRHSATWDQHLPLELVIAHIVGAFAVTIILGAAAFSVFRRFPEETFLTRPAALALCLLMVQLLLGVSAYVTRLASPDDPQPLNPMVGITVAHVACGAATFAVTIVLTLRVFKLLPASNSSYELAASAQGV
jgi:heme A synthase/plastocyanin